MARGSVGKEEPLATAVVGNLLAILDLEDLGRDDYYRGGGDGLPHDGEVAGVSMRDERARVAGIHVREPLSRGEL